MERGRFASLAVTVEPALARAIIGVDDRQRAMAWTIRGGGAHFEQWGIPDRGLP